MEPAGMKALRFAAAAAVAGLAAWLLVVVVWRPFRCHRLKSELEQASYRAYEAKTEASRAFARRSIERLTPCLAAVCRDTKVLFLLAINHRTLGEPEVALRYYEQALEIGERPEIFANIADTRLELGEHAAAFEDFVRAASFYPGYLFLIDDPALRRRVRSEVIRRHPGSRMEIQRLESMALRWGGRGSDRGRDGLP
jgi:tetratricopeptide (TPR) repeat protein